MKIRGKLTSLTLGFGAVPLVIASVLAYVAGSGALRDSNDQLLSAIRDAKKQQTELYFKDIQGNLLSLASGTMVPQALSALSRGFHQPAAQQAAVDGEVTGYYRTQFAPKYHESTGNDPDLSQLVPAAPMARALQAAYLATNPHPLGEKHKLDAASDGSEYSATHALYHPAFREYLERQKLYDIFLIDGETGDVVYTVFKEVDFASNLKSGPFATSGLGEAFRRAAVAREPGETFLVDFAPYAPSYEAPASFIATPVFSNGKLLGVLAFQMPVDRVAEMLAQQAGMGETGEVYLVGRDLLMRSNSRFSKATTILATKVQTKGVEQALAGVTGVASFEGPRGRDVLAAFAPLQVDGLEWVIVAEVERSEAFAGTTRLAQLMLLIVGLTIVAVLLVSPFFARRQAGPIIQARDVAHNIAQGALDNKIEATGEDEAAELLRALDEMQVDLRRRIQSEAEAAQNERIRTALDSVDAAVVATDADRRIIYANTAATALFGQLDLRREDTHEQDLCSVIGAAGGRCADRADRIEHRWVRRGRTVDVVGVPVVNAAGQPQGWAAQLVDRTEELAEAEAERIQVEQERETARENLRVKVALDNVGSAVMVADTDRNIIYANHSAMSLMRRAEPDFRRDVPGFAADRLVGMAVDRLRPASSKSSMAMTSGQHEDMVLGGRSIRSLENRVVDETGALLGTAIEWQDRTAEVAVEREIDALVEAAGRGDLTRRIDLEGRQGFLRQLGVGFNSLLDRLSTVFADIEDVMQHLADGDLRETVDGQYEGTFQAVGRDVNRTMEQLRAIVGQLTAVASDVGNAMEDITQGNMDLSTRTVKQASRLQETASSLEELTTTVESNADAAKKADALAAEAGSVATKGGQLVHQTIGAMDQIRRASTKISEIVTVIDGIAFQTNMLALNAAVEAARAGEQGRGFAVVATEVGNLAQRSAEAAKEVKSLIQDAASKVSAGVELAGASGETLEQIVRSVGDLGRIVAEISSATAEQATGLGRVNRTISELDSITQQNAALAEQNSSATVSVGESAKTLQGLIGHFELPKSASATTAARAAHTHSARPAAPSRARSA